MKKVFLTASMLAMLLYNVKAQDNRSTADSSDYQSRKLKTEEIDFISSVYHQEGNNSAVTGGIGNEKLTDAAINFDLKMSGSSKSGNVHSLSFELGVDAYTSASSDKIDPSTVSSASSRDLRIYPSANYNYKNIDHNYTLGTGLSFSKEFDYVSRGGFLSFSKASKDNNTELAVKASAFLDTWTVILPRELRPYPYNLPSTGGSQGRNSKGPTSTAPRNSYNLDFVFSHVINRNLQMALILDLGYQQGHLETSFQRVYFNNGTVKAEILPSTKYKAPIGLRANYFLGDNIVIRSFYRYYIDSWNIQTHTISIEPTYKLTPFTSIGLLYRFNDQIGTGYFKPINEHAPTDTYYTSDYDLSSLSSNMVGANFRIMDSNKGLLGIHKLNTLELRYAYYNRSNGLVSNIVSLLMKFK
ncbi:MAG: DUF3570 domain-containing protein [Bacteroidetes bacterium]|nr:DUF3570 domain-containing protein [Bacteroidota bacterium]